MKRLLLGFFTLMYFLSANAAGLLGFGPDSEELKIMPDYCQANAKGPQAPEHQYWSNLLGKQFSGFHHYCAGLNQLNRFHRLINDPKRSYYLSRAVPEMNYVMDKMPPNFPLAGEMYLNRGLAKQAMKQNAAAMTDFQTAINNNPKLPQAYIGIAEFHENANQKQKALEIVTKGLIEAPDNKALKRKYLKLGGKEPFPVAKIEPNQIKQTPMPEPSESPKGTENTNNMKAVETEKAATKSSEINNDTKADSKSGTSSLNPYCRFCP